MDTYVHPPPENLVIHMMAFYFITCRNCPSSLPSFFLSHKPLYVRISECQWRPIHQTYFSDPLWRERAENPS